VDGVHATLIMPRVEVLSIPDGHVVAFFRVRWDGVRLGQVVAGAAGGGCTSAAAAAHGVSVLQPARVPSYLNVCSDHDGDMFARPFLNQTDSANLILAVKLLNWLHDVFTTAVVQCTTCRWNLP
jgi:hypothetical protein